MSRGSRIVLTIALVVSAFPAVLFSDLFVQTVEADLTDGLVAHWEFEETADNSCSGGEDMCDSSGNGHHATAHNGLNIVDGPVNVGSARDFNGSGDYGSVPFHSDFNFGNTFSLSTWVYHNTRAGGAPDYVDLIFSKASGGTVGSYDWRINPSGTHGFVFRHTAGGGGQDYIFDNDALPLNTWTHIVVTYDGSYLRYYTDAEEKNEVAQTRTIANLSSTVMLGRHNHGSPYQYYYDGIIDDFRVYDRKLTEDEVNDLYDMGKITYNQLCPKSVQARINVGDLGHRQSGTYDQSTADGDTYDFSWSAVMNEDAINQHNVFGGEVTLTMPDTSTVTRGYARGETIALPAALGTYNVKARALNGDLCDEAEITIVADTSNGLVSADTGVGVTSEVGGNDRTTVPGSGTEWVYVRNGGGDIVGKIQVDLSSGYDWRAMVVDHKTPAETGGAGLAVLHYPGGADNIPGIVGTSYYLYVPRDASDTNVRICPGAESVDDLSSTCDNGITLPEGTTGQYTVTKVNLEGDDLWEIAGVTSTGGLGTQEGNTLYIDLDAQPGVMPSNISTAPEIAISTADEFYASYIPSSTEFASADYIDIVIPQSWSGLATCASSTTDADGDSTADGSMSVQDSQIIRYTFSAATTTALTSGVEVCFAATSPGSPGNYSIASSDTNDGDYSAALIYVGDDNDVTLTGTVPATLSLRIKEPTTTSDTNTCDLGVLNPASINSCSYRIAAGTNNTNGLEVFVLADATLDNAGATADIDDTGAGTDIVAGTEGHGVRLTLGSGFTVGASFSESNDNPVPQTETLILDTAYAINDSNTVTWSTVTHSASINSATAVDTYNQLVTYRAWIDS